MEKVLPFTYPVIIDAYSGVAGKIAVLSGYNYCIPWIVSNFIGIGTNNNFYDNGSFLYFVHKAFEEDPWIEKSIFKVDELHDNLIEFIIEAIDSNKYIRLNLDHYYISVTERYQNQHYLHDHATIYGYDLQRKVFYAADNFVIGKFTTMEIPFSEVKEAVINLKNEEHRNIETWSLNDSAYYKFDLQFIIQLLKDYLKSEYSPLNDFMGPSYTNCIFGLEVYNYLKGYLKLLSEGKVHYDIRGFHVLCNHMSVLMQLVEYLRDNSLIQNSQNIIENIVSMREKSLSSRNLFIKYNITQNAKTLKKIEHHLEEIFIMEKTALELILDNIANENLA